MGSEVMVCSANKGIFLGGTCVEHCQPRQNQNPYSEGNCLRRSQNVKAFRRILTIILQKYFKFLNLTRYIPKVIKFEMEKLLLSVSQLNRETVLQIRFFIAKTGRFAGSDNFPIFAPFEGQQVRNGFGEKRKTKRKVD